MNETILDVKGLTCPLPVLKANKALRGMGQDQNAHAGVSSRLRITKR
jgi:tRNA 2-thiouridine synthesizing protein A